MEVSCEEGEIPMPLNSTTYGGHMTHREPAVVPNKHHNSVHQINIPSNNGVVVHTSIEDTLPYNKKQQARYKECLKNHAAAMGGNATDGCGEFMPSGEEGSIEALTCSVCNCHRNFHRKEVDGDQHCDFYHKSPHLNGVGRRVVFGGHHKNLLGYPTTGADAVPHQMIMSYNMGLGSLPSESGEREDGGLVGPRSTHMQLLKKRFRTKFTHEQKEKMFNFAEKVGWKIQKQEESVVQQLCQEIGVKRRVLKVWMHNNKHNLAKNNPSTVA